MKILITGGNGFIAQNLCFFLDKAGHKVVTSTRIKQETGYKNFVVGPLNKTTDWHAALEGVDCVIHLAARVHVMKETSENPLSEFMMANCCGTVRLAETAEKAGVKQFIFFSSIGVNGEINLSGPFTEADTPAPQSPYAISKFEAEKALSNICQNMNLVIIRPPLVYGPGAKGNFQSLLKLCKLPIPLPFGSCQNNKRNFLFVDNLSHFIVHCLAASCKSGLYLIADDQALSTADLIKAIRISLGKKALLFPIPNMGGILSALGKKGLATKLTDSLVINISKAKKDFLWSPPYTAQEGIKKTVSSPC